MKRIIIAAALVLTALTAVAGPGIPKPILVAPDPVRCHGWWSVKWTPFGDIPWYYTEGC